MVSMTASPVLYAVPSELAEPCSPMIPSDPVVFSCLALDPGSANVGDCISSQPRAQPTGCNSVQEPLALPAVHPVLAQPLHAQAIPTANCSVGAVDKSSSDAGCNTTAAQVQNNVAPVQTSTEEGESGKVPATVAPPEFTNNCAITACPSAPCCAPPESEKFLFEETVLIFDWDDTILPSTWVHSQGLRLDEWSELSEWQRAQLATVASAAANTLRVARQLGTILIITNAERGWIELSCQKFMPSLSPLLEGVRTFSARTAYESPELWSPLDWKLHAFESEIARVYRANGNLEETRRKNVISLGDSMHEREALLRTTAALPNCLAKSLKFTERPSPHQVHQQHTLIRDFLEWIVQHNGNLDLCIRCPDAPQAQDVPSDPEQQMPEPAQTAETTAGYQEELLTSQEILL